MARHITENDFPSKHNLAAVVPPVVGDDSSSGYEVGSTWFDTLAGIAYVCMDASVGAAVWKGTTTLTNNPVDSTGVLTGGVLQAGTGGFGATTLFSITDGSAQYVTATGVITKQIWTGQTDIAITNILTHLITFVGINSSGTIIQQTGPFTPLQTRTIAVLGVLVHVDKTNLDAVNNEQHASFNVASQLYDSMEATGFYNVSGNKFGPNGANLNIDKTAGDMFKAGSNYDTDINNPHIRTLAILTGATFQYRFSDGSNGTTGIAIDPDNLDDGAGGLTAMTNNKWSVQRIYSFTSNNVKIQRGVAEYASLDAAVNGIATEAYTPEPSIEANGLLRGWLVLKKGATALNNGAQALFLEAPKFGAGSGTVGGASTTDLQAAYLNSLANPEILTDATGGAITVRRGSAADTDDVLEVQNGAGTQTFAVDGDGNITTSGTVDGIDVATDVAANTAKVGVTTEISDIVEDTTPQLGGDLDSNGNQIQASKGADVASAAALAVLTDGNYFDVTGTTTITSINTTKVGNFITLHFDGAVTLTHHATDLILPGAANYTTAAGDEFTFVEYATGDYRCIGYVLASGEAIVGGSGDVATDTIWDAAGDLVYGTGADTGARLALGTANQKLQVNSGATAPEWVTEIKTIQPLVTPSITEGTAPTGPFAEVITDGITTGIDLLNRAYYSLTGNGVSTYQQRLFILPEDFVSWNEITLDIYGATDALYSIYIAEQDSTGAADTANIIYTSGTQSPAVTDTWERVTWTPTGSYTSGKIYTLVLRASTVGNDTIRWDYNTVIKYNAK